MLGKRQMSLMKRRFEVLRDILRDTPAYQQLLEEGRKEGRKEGLEEGLAKGLEEGLAKGLQQAHERARQRLGQKLLDLVQTRFPKLKTITKRQISLIKRPETLEDLFIKVAQTSIEEEAKD